MSYDFRVLNDASGASASAATLNIEVPHWAATIRLYNNRHELVWECSSLEQTSESPEIYVAEATLPPGIYDVETTLEGRTERKTVSLRADRPKQIGWEEWKSLKLASIAPRGSTVTSSETHTAAAEEWSRNVTWATAEGGNSRLFLFVRTGRPERHKSFADGLYLLNGAGETLTDFSDSCETDGEAGWMAFNAALPAGGYVLKRERPDSASHYVAFYLCAGWETQLFLPARSAASLRSMTVNLARSGAGFRANDREAIAAETVLDSLRLGLRGKHLVASEMLTTLMRGKLENPWLGILAAHLLLRSGASDPLVESTTEDPEPQLSELFQEVLGKLSGFDGLSDLPDLRALQLQANEPAPNPFAHPPLLQVGIQRVQNHSVRFAETIPYRSLTDSVWDNLLADSVWTAWRNLDRLPNVWNDQPATKPVSNLRSRIAAQIETSNFSATDLIQAVTAKAPVFRLTLSLEDESIPKSTAKAQPSAMNSLAEVALVQKVIEITSMAGSSDLSDVITLNVSKVLDDLLNSIVPEEVSKRMDLPLSRLKHGLQSLRTIGAKLVNTNDTDGEFLTDLTATGRAVLPYALTKAATPSREATSRSPADTSASEDAGIAMDLSDATESVAPLTIEECVNKVLSEAAGLAAKAKQNQLASECAERAISMAHRLEEVANNLLKYAEFIVVTDIDRKMLYANGAFTMLFAQPQGLSLKPLVGEQTGKDNTVKNRSECAEAWITLFEAAPLGTSSVSSPLPGMLFDDWSLRRSVINDELTNNPRAFLNILRGQTVPPSSSSIIRKVSKRLPALSLYSASFGADDTGSSERNISNASRLEDLVTELEQIVSNPMKGSTI